MSGSRQLSIVSGPFTDQLDLFVDRSLRTRASLDALAVREKGRRAAKQRLLQRSAIARRATLGILFALSLVYYGTMSVCVEIASLPSVTPIASAQFFAATARPRRAE